LLVSRLIMPNINDLLRDHVTLEVQCMDRIYLKGYVPGLQTGGQLVTLTIERLGGPIALPLTPEDRVSGYE